MALDGESVLVYDGSNSLLRTINGTLSKQCVDSLQSDGDIGSSAAGNTETLPMKISMLPVRLQIVMTQGAVQPGSGSCGSVLLICNRRHILRLLAAGSSFQLRYATDASASRFNSAHLFSPPTFSVNLLAGSLSDGDTSLFPSQGISLCLSHPSGKFAKILMHG